MSVVLTCCIQVKGNGRTTVTQSGLIVGAGGGTVTTGGLAVDAGGVHVSAGGVTVVNGGTKVETGGLFVDDNGATIASTVTAGSPTLTKIQQTSSSFAAGDVLAVKVGALRPWHSLSAPAFVPIRDHEVMPVIDLSAPLNAPRCPTPVVMANARPRMLPP